jgi:hypothetical protein
MITKIPFLQINAAWGYGGGESDFTLAVMRWEEMEEGAILVNLSSLPLCLGCLHQFISTEPNNTH